MKRLITVGVAALALTGGVAEAQAAERTVVPCWAGYDGEWDMRDRIKPGACMFNGGEAHYLTTPLRWMTWRTWGGRTACGRGVYAYNQGYRARVRFCLYGRTHYYGDTYVYTKIRGRSGTRYSYIENGRRVHRTKKPFRFKNSTW
jgi:hypothetical protein